MDEKTKKQLRKLIDEYGSYHEDMESEYVIGPEYDKAKKDLAKCEKKINKIIDEA